MEVLIYLDSPVASENVPGFPRPRTVYVYECRLCKNKVRVSASTYLGKRPIPSNGAIFCPYCKNRKI